MNGRTMRYGIGMRTQYPQGDDMVRRTEDQMAQARLADQLGFDSLLKSQHLAGYPLQEFQQVPFLGRVMAEAPNLRLLTGIVLLSLHKPLDIAEQLATIDVMSGGRLIFGAGLGYREVEFKGFGTTQKDRVPRFIENLEAIKRLWTEDEVTMKGSHFELDHVRVSLKPAQKPRPPIWIGANADGAIARAAALGDSWFINPHQKMETIARQLGIYRRALDEAGKPFPKELPLAREIFIAPTKKQAMDRCGPYLAEKYRIYHEWGQDKAMPAGDNDLSLALEELQEDRFLLGPADQIAETLIQYNRQLGVNHVVLSFHWVGMPQDLVLEQMRMFAEEVMPKVEQGI
ncbi:MAG: LLM class flavin-dependent oxidoreductase [Alphaproteobacteria bacterium]|nr:LLM class flavin-dependent oxidoreductase [Alphaproteobacteria bacterium]